MEESAPTTAEKAVVSPGGTQSVKAAYPTTDTTPVAQNTHAPQLGEGATADRGLSAPQKATPTPRSMATSSGDISTEDSKSSDTRSATATHMAHAYHRQFTGSNSTVRCASDTDEATVTSDDATALIDDPTEDDLDTIDPSPTVEAPCHISQLPSELVEIIATFLPSQALLALRRCSREIEAKTKRVFARAWFSKRHILVSQDRDFEDALDLLEDPAFCHYLETLVIDIQDPGLLDKPWYLSEERELMLELFRNLAETGRECEIEITCEKYRTRGKKGLREVDHALSLRNALTADNTAHFLAICEALSETGLKVTTLSLDTIHTRWALAVHTIGSDLSALHIMKTALQSVTSLTLDAWLPDEQGSTNLYHGIDFFDTIVDLPALRHLAINARVGRVQSMIAFADHRTACADEVIWWTFLHSDFYNLETLTLRQFVLDANDLVKFVNLQTSMQQLALRGCLIYGLHAVEVYYDPEDDESEGEGEGEDGSEHGDGHGDGDEQGEADEDGKVAEEGEDEEEQEEEDEENDDDEEEEDEEDEPGTKCRDQRLILQALRNKSGVDWIVLDPAEGSVIDFF